MSFKISAGFVERGDLIRWKLLEGRLAHNENIGEFVMIELSVAFLLDFEESRTIGMVMVE
ncbi:hypothetical protein SK128_017054, partial [Halocaridina rubra]